MTDSNVLVHNIFLKFSYDVPVREDQVIEFEEKLNKYLENLVILGIECDIVSPIVYVYERETGLFVGACKRDNRARVNNHKIPDQTINLKEPFYELYFIDTFIVYEHRTSPFEKNRKPSNESIKISSSYNRL